MPQIASQWIIDEALHMGFEACGIAQPHFLDTDAAHIEAWLEEGCQGSMAYLERNREKRYDPRKLVEGTKSIVTVLYNYFPQQQISNNGRYKIAKYAYGDDYHDVLKLKLRQLLEHIEQQTGKLEGTRIFVDSAPVLDRAWAVRCGLGFIGKNTMLIHPKKSPSPTAQSGQQQSGGSFFFIGHLFLPIELTPTPQELANRCGRCTRCIDACPTGALDAPFHLDARKCISFLTIEHKSNFDGLDPTTFKGWMYGCDACQDACPYNRFALPHREPRFLPSQRLSSMSEDDWKSLSETDFEELFKHSAVQRAGYEGLKRNIDFISREN